MKLVVGCSDYRLIREGTGKVEPKTVRSAGDTHIISYFHFNVLSVVVNINK